MTNEQRGSFVKLQWQSMALNHIDAFDCVSVGGDSFADTERTYLRKLLRTGAMGEGEFKNQFELGLVDRGKNFKNVCGQLGVSVRPFTGLAELRAHCERVALIAAKYKKRPSPFRCYCVFRLAVGAGRLRHTKTDTDDKHHDFYKDDEFTVASHTTGHEFGDLP